MLTDLRDTLIDQQQEILETKVNGPITVSQIINQVAENYDFCGHSPQYLSPLQRGLEKRKYTFWAGTQSYLLRIYSQSFSEAPRFRLRNEARLEERLMETGIPFAEAIPTINGGHYLLIQETRPMNRKWDVAFDVCKVFPGKPLTNPTVEDVQLMAGYMAKIHQIKDYGVVPAMDSWSFLKLIGAYENDLRKPELKPVLEAIKPAVEAMRKIKLGDETEFPKTLVHGDLHSFNILKNPQRGLMILDLGCMDHEQRIADPVVFLSNSCADFTNPGKTKELFKATVDAYQPQNPLTQAERDSLPALVTANYAMFALRTAELLLEYPDDKEIRDWHEHGLTGIKMMKELNWKVA